MRRIWIIAIATVLLFSGSGHTQTEPSGIIKTKSGSVQVRRAGETFRAIPGTPLHDKDVIITGLNAYAGLLFKDGTAITLGPSSEFTIQTYLFEPRDQVYFFSFFMNKGSIIYNSGSIGKLSPKSVRLATPKATVGIRGTRFIVDLN